MIPIRLISGFPAYLHPDAGNLMSGTDLAERRPFFAAIRCDQVAALMEMASCWRVCGAGYFAL